ncbi:Lrp/AsnC family transcriptional regulator [Rhizosaccharibacter radicis]|uniref:Lrp/AsnC family transcriptional regulator n=1 Tax=Rhizosaccharibacter radicis TaxID=2782605 RepID=A0ABT1VWI5_9PROT|nr:Lrp/AsnC family transcriptional regulator [Acetobacteraceae bacterium KSS12]
MPRRASADASAAATSVAGRGAAPKDRIDLRILRRLQEDATDTVAELAERVGLSANACWRRVRAMEEAGIIRRRVTLLDPASLGLGATVFVSIRTGHHDERWLESFAAGVRAIPEVVSAYRMSGQVDYLLKIVVADIAHYDRVYRALIAIAPMVDVSSSFAMEELKDGMALPLPDETVL